MPERAEVTVRVPLALLNVVGGLAVLGSYVLAFVYSPTVREGLWGGVPEALRPLYTVNMLLAALGYFPFTWLFVFGKPKGTTIGSDRFDRQMRALYALILIPSALWLPLTAVLIESPNLLLWTLVRLDLFCVAVGALGVLVRAFQHGRATASLVGWLPLSGAIPFFIQTGILDAIVWPYFYPI